jgi:hypothetical protein
MNLSEVLDRSRELVRSRGLDPAFAAVQAADGRLEAYPQFDGEKLTRAKYSAHVRVGDLSVTSHDYPFSLTSADLEEVLQSLDIEFSILDIFSSICSGYAKSNKRHFERKPSQAAWFFENV